MDIVMTSETRSFVLDHGAVLYVRTRGPRRCNRGLALVEVSTRTWGDQAAYQRIEQDGVVVLFRPKQGMPPPRELTVGLRGRRTPTLRGYWDGCSYAI